ncbi:DUF2059 domain-containing protein [Psychromonas aquimarina]|uniref:DUF2059 domain-containing protein n=1 Tax=Psychromonas aquimarina TaxID=444919 RepID=UPI000402BBCC|nr:DUF2059 domain-containing protein [Psychromonas aquimarina]
MNYLWTICFIIGVVFTPYSAAKPASAESIKALMHASGSGSLGEQMLRRMLPSLKKMIPEAQDSFWTNTMAEIDTDEVEKRIIPVYQKYLTEKDIQAINAFYNTPAGKKMLQIQPKIMRESYAIGQKWAQKTAKQVLQKYQEQYKNLP